MSVIGECLDDIGTVVDEVAVHLFDDFRMVEHRFGHECAGLDVAAALELEQIAFGADDRTPREPLDEALTWRSFGGRGFLHAIHTHWQWLLLAPNVLPAAKRE